MNKKGVEGLPLKYVIIALVAVLVIGIVLQFVGIIKVGTIGAAEKINETVTEKTTCQLDETSPSMEIVNKWCNSTENKTYVKAKITDECGVEKAITFLNDGSTLVASKNLERVNGTNTNGTWESVIEDSNISDYGGKELTVSVWARDKTDFENEETAFENVTC